MAKTSAFPGSQIARYRMICNLGVQHIQKKCNKDEMVMPLDDRLFSRGGFSSSYFDGAETSNSTDVMNYTCQSDNIQKKLIVKDSKTKRDHIRSKYGFST